MHGQEHSDGHHSAALGGAGRPADRRMAERSATEQLGVRVLDTATLLRM